MLPKEQKPPEWRAEATSPRVESNREQESCSPRSGNHASQEVGVGTILLRE